MKALAFAVTICLAVALGSGVDAMRAPQQQLTAHCYQAVISTYRAYIHPVTGRFIRCRYRPTCSRYSSLAVRRFGIARGLRLTISRLLSCRSSVRPGTLDPVPAQ